MGETRVKRNEGRGAGAGTKQVYLRFVGMRGDAPFESAQCGPWDVKAQGDLIRLAKADLVELKHTVKSLEQDCQVSGLRVQMAEVNPAGCGCVLGEWREVVVSVRSPVEAGEVLSVDELRGKVNRLHAAREGWVKAAREARVVKGMGSRNFVEAWGKVESLTEEIAVAEADLERELEADASRPHPPRAALWRDPDAEMPEDGLHVMVRTKDWEVPGGVCVGYAHSGFCWETNDGDDLDESVTGWMPLEEAAAALDAAARGAADERKPKGPCNASMKAAMLKTARAFHPDLETLMKPLRKAASKADALEEAHAVLSELTEYGATAGAEILRRASSGTLAEQLDAVERAYPMIGAPGDFGYGTARGSSWYALLQLAAEVGENGKEADNG